MVSVKEDECFLMGKSGNIINRCEVGI